MELIDINVAPGILREDTERGAVGRWYDCDKVRFRYDLPEKMRGWVDYESANAILPGTLVVESIDGVSVTLSWTPAEGEDEIAEQLQRRLAPDGEWMNVTGATESPFIDGGLEQETQYDWRVRYNFGAIIVFSNIARATTDNVPLVAGVLSAGVPTDTEVTLTWTSATGGEGAIVATLQRSLAGADDWTDIATESPHTDMGLTPETSYDYRVRFVDEEPDTVFSNVVNVLTEATPLVLTYEVFLSSGTFTPPDGVTEGDVLLVAGGGAGGCFRGGGGGAGGLVISEGVSFTGPTSVVIGAGGVGVVASAGGSGGNSSFGSITATGGGGGGLGANTLNGGISGGSGGGAGGADTGGSQAPGLGVSGQGNNGGDSLDNTSATTRAGGGGGGFGSVGGNASASTGGNGGAGVTLESIGWDSAIAEGAPSIIAGGGGGSTNAVPGTQGVGSGGGSNGNASADPADATANTGGGGGGAGGGVASILVGGNGGSGIAIVRYFA